MDTGRAEGSHHQGSPSVGGAGVRGTGVGGAGVRGTGVGGAGVRGTGGRGWCERNWGAGLV